MPIDINGLNNVPPHVAGETAQAQTQSVHKAPSAAQQEAGKPATGDTVSLTDAANLLKKLEKSLDALPVVDTQRTEALRRAIADGTYQVDPQRVADKLLAFDTMLHGADDQ